MIALLVLLALCSKSESMLKDVDFNYIGEQPCNHNSNIKGYNDLIILNQDMYLDAFEIIDQNKTIDRNYNYNICGGSILDVDKATSQSGVDEVIVIYLPNTTICCNGDDCIIQGGNFQILFTPLLDARNTLIKGITFTNNKMYSITGYGSSYSDVSFIDCIWKDNLVAASLVVMYNAPSKSDGRLLEDVTYYDRSLVGYQSMSINFHNCVFQVS